MKLAEKFYPYCDYYGSSQNDNAEACVDIAEDFSIGFVKWFDFLNEEWYSENDTMISYLDMLNFYKENIYDSTI
jgi:hypothetical protein